MASGLVILTKKEKSRTLSKEGHLKASLTVSTLFHIKYSTFSLIPNFSHGNLEQFSEVLEIKTKANTESNYK